MTRSQVCACRRVNQYQIQFSVHQAECGQAPFLLASNFRRPKNQKNAVQCVIDQRERDTNGPTILPGFLGGACPRFVEIICHKNQQMSEACVNEGSDLVNECA